MHSLAISNSNFSLNMSSFKSTNFARNSQANPSSLFSPLQLNADFHWIADTGATSHMTPYHHWFKSYTHYRTPIHLANNIVIYSAGVGNVVFEPIVMENKLEQLSSLKSSMFLILEVISCLASI